MNRQTNEGQVVICIVEFKDKVVVGKVVEASLVNYNNLPYIFPAGKVSAGESINDAATRIVKEALGVDSKIIETVAERTHPLTQKKITYILCRVEGTIPKSPGNENADVSQNVLIAKKDIKKYVPNVYAKVLEYMGIEE